MKRFISSCSLILVLFLLISFVFSCFNGKDLITDPDQTSESTDSSSDSDNLVPEEPEISSIDFSEMNYIAYGDSITWGLYNSQRMEFPYPSLVSTTLGLKSYKNSGVNGATLCSNDKGYFCMTDKILSNTEKADIISVMLGVNDYNRNLPLGTINDTDNTTIYGSLNLIANHFDTYYEDSFVFFMTPYKERFAGGDSFRINSQGYNLMDVSNAIIEVAALHGYPVLDMFNYGRFEIEYKAPESDGVHPSQTFVRDYTTPQIVEFIRKNCK